MTKPAVHTFNSLHFYYNNSTKLIHVWSYLILKMPHQNTLLFWGGVVVGKWRQLYLNDNRKKLKEKQIPYFHKCPKDINFFFALCCGSSSFSSKLTVLPNLSFLNSLLLLFSFFQLKSSPSHEVHFIPAVVYHRCSEHTTLEWDILDLTPHFDTHFRYLRLVRFRLDGCFFLQHCMHVSAKRK